MRNGGIKMYVDAYECMTLYFLFMLSMLCVSVYQYNIICVYIWYAKKIHMYPMTIIAGSI